MDRLCSLVGSSAERVKAALADQKLRRDLLFICLSAALCVIAAVMTAVNIFTREYTLAIVTGVFAVACLINLLLARCGKRCNDVAKCLLDVQLILVCTFFCVTGTPEGFGAMWFCFIPAFSLSFKGRRRGSIYSGIAFLIVAVLFWTPFGRGLLQCGYSDAFMLRFPLMFAAFYMVGMLVESLYELTHRHLIEEERHYAFLYHHDALTGLYNRYGFNEQMDREFASEDPGPLSLLMIDVDDFKSVNDTYGHSRGDIVLKLVADILNRETGEKDKVCRWGGEEFTVLLSGSADAEKIAESIRAQIEAADVREEGDLIKVTVSIGLGMLHSRRSVPIARFVNGTDRCLYIAKEAGKNHVHSEWLD